MTNSWPKYRTILGCCSCSMSLSSRAKRSDWQPRRPVLPVLGPTSEWSLLVRLTSRISFTATISPDTACRAVKTQPCDPEPMCSPRWKSLARHSCTPDPAALEEPNGAGLAEAGLAEACFCPALRVPRKQPYHPRNLERRPRGGGLTGSPTARSGCDETLPRMAAAAAAAACAMFRVGEEGSIALDLHGVHLRTLAIGVRDSRSAGSVSDTSILTAGRGKGRPLEDSGIPAAASALAPVLRCLLAGSHERSKVSKACFSLLSSSSTLVDRVASRNARNMPALSSALGRTAAALCTCREPYSSRTDACAMLPLFSKSRALLLSSKARSTSMAAVVSFTSPLAEPAPLEVALRTGAGPGLVGTGPVPAPASGPPAASGEPAGAARKAGAGLQGSGFFSRTFAANAGTIASGKTISASGMTVTRGRIGSPSRSAATPTRSS
mmetsp:Transcript_7100/g.15295  ORF Transcript_7100/g.15295 Transcript_7100/m.15295 type:complete len:438 (+) Transcript_7100:761-2074(+)